jgi:DNA (cytosine-5)-methyltransferase 1
MILRVAELFAGVGGFRIGLEGPPGSDDSSFQIIFSNQWEPATKRQHAAEIYVDRWSLKPLSDRPLWYEGVNKPEVFVNDDIASISSREIPDHDLLVGGFPCQDYSVAKTLDKAEGLQGKKGVLWWEIYRILKDKKPNHVLLENVDRLIKSPVKQRGRDFAVMLSCFSDLGYAVEWRVINAADYGMPQRRRRVFIYAHHESTKQHKQIRDCKSQSEWLFKAGQLAMAFPVQPFEKLILEENRLREEGLDLADLSENFNISGLPGNKSPFENTGLMYDNKYWTTRTSPLFQGPFVNLGDILVSASKIGTEYILSVDSLTKAKGWQYLKGSKKELRQGRDGFTYHYNEGGMIFPDALNRPSRTIITGEGGSSPSRFKHVVKFNPTKGQMEELCLSSEEHQKIRIKLGLKKYEWVRRLVPLELERLNQFPDNHTRGATDAKRAFFMGNALVIGIVERIGNQLLKSIEIK